MTTSQETPSTRKRHARRQPAARTTPTTLQTTEKRADAIRLRIAGLSYEQIAGELGYANRSAAFKAVEAGRREVLAEPADELVALESIRLDAMLRNASQVLEAAKADGDSELVLKALDRQLRISERRARLHGLDAPARTELSGGGPLQVVFHPALAPRDYTVIDGNG